MSLVTKIVALKVSQKEIEQPKNILDTIECQLCTYLVSQADNLLKQNKTEQEILDEVLRICNRFSSDIQPQVSICLCKNLNVFC